MAQNDIDDMIKKLTKALETDLYYGNEEMRVRDKLRHFLAKLGIKSAKFSGQLTYGGILRIEDIEATMNKEVFGIKEKFDAK